MFKVVKTNQVVVHRFRFLLAGVDSVGNASLGVLETVVLCFNKFVGCSRFFQVHITCYRFSRDVLKGSESL